MAHADPRSVWVIEVNGGTKAKPDWIPNDFYINRAAARKQAAACRENGWPVRVVKYTPAG